MKSNRYTVAVTFTFSGHVVVRATSAREAVEIAEASFGLVIGGDLHETDDRIVDWDFSLHPDKHIDPLATPT